MAYNSLAGNFDLEKHAHWGVSGQEPLQTFDAKNPFPPDHVPARIERKSHGIGDVDLHDICYGRIPGPEVSQALSDRLLHTSAYVMRGKRRLIVEKRNHDIPPRDTVGYWFFWGQRAAYVSRVLTSGSSCDPLCRIWYNRFKREAEVSNRTMQV